jgi:hypothetical protein
MHDITYCGLNGWSQSLFEKFGYMILAHHNGDHHSTKCYISNIESLHTYVLEKLEHLYKMNLKEHSVLLDDKINDMKILRDNIDKLHKVANMLFVKKNMNHKVVSEKKMMSVKKSNKKSEQSIKKSNKKM